MNVLIQQMLWFLLLACPRPLVSTEAPMPALNADATLGSHDPQLQQLLSDHWEDQLRRYPVDASRLGDHRYDDRLARTNPEAIADSFHAQREFLERAKAIPSTRLDPADQLTQELFIDLMETGLEGEVCHSEQWGLSARNNPVPDLEYLPEVQPILLPQDGRNLAARYRAADTLIDDTIANLQAGIAAGRTPSRASVQRVDEQLQTWLAQPCSETALWNPIKEAHLDWSPQDLASVRSELEAGATQACAAVKRFHGFVTTELLPKSRDEAHEGVLYLPDGPACYQARVRDGSSLSLAPQTIHQMGLDALEQTHAEMRSLGKKLFGTDDLKAITERLRTDKSLYFSTEQEVEDAARNALDRANAAVPALFGRLPKTPCVVKRIPDSEAPYTTIAYYRQPVPDGSQPGEYRINVYAPTTRPRFEAQVLAYHESVPGHHLQIAISQELPAVPAFRRNMIANAYVEGWALYTERLADEVGLYSSDLDRMGMLSFDSWRSSRLVVDTGLHALGWSRAQAVQFMLDNTALTENNIRNEVDRYISWPGQALGYKLGQLEILRLRSEAKTSMGSRFSLPAFHDAILAEGPLTLAVLRRRMETWMKE